MKSNKGNRKSGGPSGPPSFWGPKTQIVAFDWSTISVDHTRSEHPPPDTPPDQQQPPSSISKADNEWTRFLAVAIPTPNGLGLYDPAESPEMPSGFVVSHSDDRPTGVPRGWTVRSWVRHLKYMANACAALNPEKSSEYLSKAEQLEDCCNV